MRILTVGTSKITATLIKAFKANDIEVYAACGRSLAKTKQFCADNGVLKAYDNYDEALDDEMVDAVYIGLPNSLHYPYAYKALLKSKHVILEKPFTSNVKQCISLVRLALKQKVILFEAILPIHLPAYKKLKTEIASLGKLTNAELNFSKYSSKYDAFKMGEFPSAFSVEYAGGALMDLGLYTLYYAIDLFGMPKTYHYTCNIEKGIDVSGTYILGYDDFYVTGTSLKDSDAHNFVSISGQDGYLYYQGAPSLIDNFEKRMRSGETISYRYPFDDAYYYEVACFKELVANCDFVKMGEYLKKTVSIMTVLDELRKVAGISF